MNLFFSVRMFQLAREVPSLNLLAGHLHFLESALIGIRLARLCRFTSSETARLLKIASRRASATDRLALGETAGNGVTRARAIWKTRITV